MINFFKKKYAWAIIYSVFLTVFTVYLALDTFVITKVYSKIPSQEGEGEKIKNADGTDSITNKTNVSDKDMENAFGNEINEYSPDSEKGSTVNGTNNSSVDEEHEYLTNDLSDSTAINSENSMVVSKNSYSDENITITLTEYREYDTLIYVADVIVSSSDYLQTAFAQNAYGRNVTEKTSTMAENNNAILAINGDYYGAQENGYVIRNGILYRNTASKNQEDLVIYRDGTFSIISEEDTSAEQLIEDGAREVLSFGPGLIKDGTIAVSENDEVGKAKASNPRTAIGIVDDLHYLFVVSDGRTDESKGLSLLQLAEFMQGLGTETAYNLDGGGSSTMYFNGEIVNNPTTNGRSIKERSVSDIVYIGYK